MKKTLLTLVLTVGMATVLLAQGPPPPPPPPPVPPPGTGAPIDTDIALLLIGTALFGAYKLRKTIPA